MLLHVEHREHIVWLTLDHPPANALNNALLRELVSALTDIVADRSIRGVVVTGAGTRFFTPGGDVKEFSTISEEEGEARVRLGSQLKSLLGAVDCPLVCAINGVAVGSGMEMAALADFCVASSTARFGMPEINHGLLPMARGIQQLVKVLGYNNARKVLYDGIIYSVQEAFEMGLVDEIVEPERLEARATEWITAMAAKPPQIFTALKRMVNQSLTMSDSELEEMTAADLKGIFKTDEATARLDTLIGRQRAADTRG
jgi:enoyl-CoA hydratase/carnithine racemase